MKFQINESEKKRIKDLYQINEQGMRGYLLRMLSDDEPQSYSKTVPSSSNVFPYDVLNRFGLGSKESLDFNSAPIPRLTNIINHIKKYEEFVPYTYDDATVSESVASSWLTDFVEDECVPCIKRWQKDTKTKVTPSIFEALIDVVYNKGCSGFRKSPIATELENNNVVRAAEVLKNWEGWGNKNRREAVYINFFKKGIK
jgi:hypothetical protein